MMTEQDAAQILLVRSIEEIDPKTFPPARLAEALTAAGSDLRPSAWFLARARHLLESVPHFYAAIVRMAQLPAGWTIAICGLSLLIGFATNYLGSFTKIPILLNPIMALAGWNLLLYVALFFWWLRSRLIKSVRPSTNRASQVRAAPASAAPAAAPMRSTAWAARVLFPSLWIWLHSLTLRFLAGRKQVAYFAGVARRFWSHWTEAARPLVIARWKYLAHCASIALTVGASAGMYIRGIFLRYDVIWSSTFITDPETISKIVYIVFAPALWTARVAGRDFGAEIDIARLMSAEGTPAAVWIHLFVLTALLVIVVPRSLLALAQGFYLQRAKADIRIDFDDYFGRLIRPQIEALIAQEIQRGITSFAETMADFVCEQFYDERIVPELTRFRNSGGRIADLRARIHERCEEGRNEINLYAGAAVQKLESSVGPSVDRVLSAVRQDFRLAAAIRQDLPGNLEILPESEFGRSMEPIGEGFTNAIGASISASMAVALGTLAGGFGESLEIAVIVALFGTTGPVGFLIGAIIGLIVAAGAWWWGRDKLTEQIEGISLPSKLVKIALWQSRFDNLIQEGRIKCHELVITRVNELLSPLSSRIGAEVWSSFEKVWHARQSKADQP